MLFPSSGTWLGSFAPVFGWLMVLTTAGLLVLGVLVTTLTVLRVRAAVAQMRALTPPPPTAKMMTDLTTRMLKRTWSVSLVASAAAVALLYLAVYLPAVAGLVLVCLVATEFVFDKHPKT